MRYAGHEFIAALLALLATAGWPSGRAIAEDYPSHAITLIVPFPPGGGVDTIGRVISAKLAVALGQQIIVENRPGAGAVIGTRAAAKAPPDGYTLVMLTTGVSLPANTGYEIAKDFAPIGTISSMPIVVMANPSVPAKSLADVIALAKKEPGKLTVGTPAAADAQLFRRRAVQGDDRHRHHHRHLQGHRPADQRSGRRSRHARLQHPAAGDRQHPGRQAQRHRGCARRSGSPRSPTCRPRPRRACRGFDVVLYYGLAAPAGTPRPIIERLNKELRAIVASDEIQKRIVADGGGPAASTPEEYAANIEREEGKWSAMIKKLGLVVN